MLYLRQSTASQSVTIGRFVDDTDGKTSETGLTIANTDIKLSKNGAAAASKNSGGATHDQNGYYTITLDATDTDTVGRLQLTCVVAGALEVQAEYHVLEESVYDNLFAASAVGPLTAAQVNAEVDTALADYDAPTKAELDSALAALNDPTAAAIADAVWDEAAAGHVSAGTFGKNVGSILSGVITGTAATGMLSTTQATTDLTGYADDQLIGRILTWTSGACEGEQTDITDYASASGLMTFTALTTAPGNGDTFKIT